MPSPDEALLCTQRLRQCRRCNAAARMQVARHGRHRAHPPKPTSNMASTRAQATLHMSRAQEPRQRMDRMLSAAFCMRPNTQSAVAGSRVVPSSVASSAELSSLVLLHWMRRPARQLVWGARIACWPLAAGYAWPLAQVHSPPHRTIG